MNLSIILPTYNEKDNIIPLINKIINSVKKERVKLEIIVVDDNSPDKTATVCKKYFLKNKSINVYVRRGEKGFASAILYGIKKSKGDIIIVMDTDFSHNPRLIPRMLRLINKYDIVLGSRYVTYGGGENKKRYWLSKIYNIYLKLILKVPINDFLFGYFCIKKNFMVKHNLATKHVFTGFGDYFIRLAYFGHKANGKFKEIPAYYKDRIYGVSKSNIYKMVVTYTFTSLKLRLRN